MKAKAGSSAPAVLYFGAQYERSEFLYWDEFKEYLSKGVLTHLKTAFSRDQAKKIYIQDKIDEDPQLVYDLMVKQGGSFYMCGPARRVPEDIRQAIVTHKQNICPQRLPFLDVEHSPFHLFALTKSLMPNFSAMASTERVRKTEEEREKEREMKEEKKKE